MNIELNLLLNTIKDSLMDMKKHPFDNVTDIWNEKFEEWDLPLRMDYDYTVEVDTSKVSCK